MEFEALQNRAPTEISPTLGPALTLATITSNSIFQSTWYLFPRLCTLVSSYFKTIKTQIKCYFSLQTSLVSQCQNNIFLFWHFTAFKKRFRFNLGSSFTTRWLFNCVPVFVSVFLNLLLNTSLMGWPASFSLK